MVLLASAGCASEKVDEARTVPTTVAAPAPAEKAAPRWERIAQYSGSGRQRTGAFSVADHVLQWRVTATCSGARLRVGVVGEPSPLAEPECPGRAFGFSIREGPVTLDVDATGGWEIVVDQQVETPATEPRLAGMSDGAAAAAGAFYPIDQEGRGTVRLWRLPGDRWALRFDPFYVTPNTDLYVWLTETTAPRTSAEALRSTHRQIAELTASAGPQNYLLPEDVDARRVRSVVIWCEPVRTAYAAAALAAA
ncbi:MAG TPA: DM13 domain-containing protein [Acidimicrobiales bacterium]